MGSAIDLHIHTTASDGTDSPRELLWNIQKAGVNIFAITDHDTIKGVLEMKKIIPAGMRFIQGIEFSCRTKSGSKCHILGLNYDEHNVMFQDAIRTGDNLRHQKFFKRIETLRSEFGITFTDDEIDSLLKIPSVGKPHIANMIVMKGLASDRQDAITRYIDRCRTGVDRIDAEQAVRAILSAGGIPVWAHPLGGEGEPELPEHKFRVLLGELVGYGLKGLECWYSKYPQVKCRMLVRWAERNGLCISGGSDYHGTNKSIPLGKLNSENINVDSGMLNILRKIQGA
ncbi:MAG: PHP domain-containing protein [Synergistaceae bacterium]|nr:PHP domain-containing protein [Synergistaceae bacterium]